MQVICPSCHAAFAVDAAAPPGACPSCGRALPPGPNTHPSAETLSDPAGPSPTPDEPHPRRLGRYLLTARVGSGGFGVVYKGYDTELHREVAVKVPHRHRLDSPEDARAYLDEARVLARLDHPGIVPVYDVGHNEDGVYYLVSKFIEGEDLAARLARSRPTPAEAARLVAEVADALHHAHERGLVHRDVKPGNILLDRDGRPYVSDFGLALKEEDFAQGPGFAGTPAYMSPEQARSEGHRVDGRTDVFSLGVVFYETLTGRPPFQGETVSELLEQITSREVQPPHHLDPAIPRELERICLRALAKRAADRYATARELADDLRHWLSQLQIADCRLQIDPSQSAICNLQSAIPRVVPKGLRPFGAEDADFFLELLPGPRDRDGLPASIRFWKTRVECTDPATAFSVGLLYGPSGCGKSSLVRAGIIPRLAPQVTPVYVEAAREGTERRVLGGLWHACPSLAGEMDLAAVVGTIRRGQALSAGRKLLFILDQFEQFLHGNLDRLAGSPLVAALRQADGARVQFLLLVREDFWPAASRLFQELEVPLVEGHNMELCDLFEPPHARKVLRLFGQAHGCLPAQAAEFTPEQQAFLDRAVAGLTEDGKVIPVRISLFAEMMKAKPWTPQALEAVGGPQGVGLTFLEENFSAKAARPERRGLEGPVRALLSALLPEAGSDIKGRVRSHDELQTAAGMRPHPHRFERLLALLDRDLRIITPVEPPADGPLPDGRGSERPSGQFYQLTHDYLVPSIRAWLTQRRRETWQGRAELSLEERTAQWTRSPQDRFLPSPFEYASILAGVPGRRYRPEERALMRAASWHYGTIATLVLALVSVLGWGAWEANGRIHAAELVRAVQKADPAELGKVIAEDLPGYRRWADPQLRTLAEAPAGVDPHRQLRARLALVDVDPSQVEPLSRALLDPLEDLAVMPVLRDKLYAHRDGLTGFLWQALRDPARPGPARLHAGIALALYDADGPWTAADLAFLAEQLLGSSRDQQHDLRAGLAPLAGPLLGPLQEKFRDAKARPGVRAAAADALAEYAGDRPELLARLTSEATPEQYDVLFGALEKSLRDEGPAALDALLGLVREQPPTEAGEVQRVEVGQRRAGAAITLFHLGERLAACDVFAVQDDPEALTQFVHRLKDRRLKPEDLLDALALEQSAATHARFGLLLALGEFAPEEFPAGSFPPLKERVAEWYRSDPRSAVHGACGWLLRAWKCPDADPVDRTPLPYDPTGQRDWFVQQVGDDFFTFVVFAPGTFLMGSPASEGHRHKNEWQHPVRLTRPFAVADREVTRGQFERFLRATNQPPPDVSEPSPSADNPAVQVAWFDATGYCRWLTEQTGKEDARRTVFRLPTEAEWEYACRAGTATPYSFGSDRDLLGRYGWHLHTHTEVGGLLRPNLRGLFDLHGNAWEWCQDVFGDYADGEQVDPQGPTEGANRVLRGGGWDRSPWHCRSAYRHSPTPDYRGAYNGFRLVQALK